MIVKNEAPRLARCLVSVKPWIDAWVIVDTGSTDNTVAVVNNLLDDIPGALVERPFTNFSDSRNHALRGAENMPCDYILLIDADMELVVEDPAWRDDLTADAYLLTQRTAHLDYRNIRLVKRTAAKCYVGFTHEYLDVQGTKADLDGVWLRDHADGSNREGKFDRDIKLLDAELDNDPNNPRTAFYLAQSYRDRGHTEAALIFYKLRADMPGGWIEETYVALLNAARLMDQLGRAPALTLVTYRRAIKLIPTRAEAYHGAARLCRTLTCWHDAYWFTSTAVNLQQPEGLFVEPWVYRWGMLDEYSIAAYWCGYYQVSLEAAERVLARTDLDAETRMRIAQNAEFARHRLG